MNVKKAKDVYSAEFCIAGNVGGVKLWRNNMDF